MVPFAGWVMPVHYGRIADEHEAVRRRVGMFDVSHMGELVVEGKGAGRLLDELTSNDMSRLEVGMARYTLLLTPEGTCVDDLIVYRTAEDRYLLVVNAANTACDLEWIVARAPLGVSVRDVTVEKALLAVQGPEAEGAVAACAGPAAGALRPFRAVTSAVAGKTVFLSRTGYTGEDGFEVMTCWGDATCVWEALMEAGADVGIRPCGLGARDLLRLEAGLPLYGNELDRTHTVLEAGLDRFVKFDKGVKFVGRRALEQQRRHGFRRTLRGFVLEGRAVPRSGNLLLAHDGTAVGRVTSGNYSPSLGRGIGMGYVSVEHAAYGAEIFVSIRGKRWRGEIVRLPFYRRKKKEILADEQHT